MSSTDPEAEPADLALIQANVSGRDLVGFVEEAKAAAKAARKQASKERPQIASSSGAAAGPSRGCGSCACNCECRYLKPGR